MLKSIPYQQPFALQFYSSGMTTTMLRTENGEGSSCAVYLKTFLNILSSLQWIPFSIHFSRPESLEENHCVYQVKEKRLILKIIAALHQFGALVSVIYASYLSVVKSQTKNGILLVLTVISFTADTWMTLITWNLIWFRRKLILETLMGLHTFYHDVKFWKLKAYCMALLVTLLSISTGILSPHQNNIDKTIPDLILNATMGVWSGPRDDDYKEDPIYQSIIKSIFHWWMFCSGRVASLAKCFLFIFAFTMNAVSNQFVTQIQNIHSIDQLMFHLQKLKELNEHINRSCGTMFINLFVITLSYYAVTPILVMKAGRFKTHWYKIINILLSSLTWIWSCEFHRKVQTFLRKWLRDHKNSSWGNVTLTQTDIGKMNLLAMEIEHDPVCISCRYFIVNYGLVFSLLGLLVTYSIITFQFQVQSSG